MRAVRKRRNLTIILGQMILLCLIISTYIYADVHGPPKFQSRPEVIIPSSRGYGEYNLSIIMVGEYIDKNNNNIPECAEIISRAIVKSISWNIHEKHVSINEKNVTIYEYYGFIQHEKGKIRHKSTDMIFRFYIFNDDNVTLNGKTYNTNDIKIEINISNWYWKASSGESKFFIEFALSSDKESAIRKKDSKTFEIEATGSDIKLIFNVSDYAYLDNRTYLPTVENIGNLIILSYDQFGMLYHDPVIKIIKRIETEIFFKTEILSIGIDFLLSLAIFIILVNTIKRKLKAL